MEFTQEQLEIIEKLAGINYTVKQVAVYFDISEQLLYNEYEDKECDFSYHFDRGKLMVKADVDIKLLDAAKDGNLTAAAMIKKAQRESRLNNLKHEYFGL